jgi:adenylate cyclase
MLWTLPRIAAHNAGGQRAERHTPPKLRPRCAGNDASMPAFLKELQSENAFELGDFALIGRTDGATIRLLDSSISRQHASIRREDGDFWIVDLGSSNGTYVNDVAVTSARLLRNDDRVQFGSTVLVFQQSDAPDSQAFAVDAKTQMSTILPVPATSIEATLLVADLRGFTKMSAQLSPGEVADLLREWYTDCMDILKRHRASIDKFIGDCVFAYWYRADADARRSALMAAQALRRIEGMSTSPARQSLRANHNLSLDCRIGLHVGEVAIGTMGRGINTAVGDAVNIAFRIESLTRLIDRPALVSRDFVEGWEDAPETFEPCGHHRVKGQDAPIEVFAPRMMR